MEVKFGTEDGRARNNNINQLKKTRRFIAAG